MAGNKPAPQANGAENMNEILKIRREKLAELVQNGRNPFEITKYNQTHTSAEIKDNFEELEGKRVSVAGRIMSKRGMGKVAFVHVQDFDGQIQLFVKRDLLGDDEYAIFKKYDIGDIVGAEGEVFKTQAGEVSVRADKVTLLSK